MSIATKYVEQPGVLKGEKGAVRLSTIKLYRTVEDILPFLNRCDQICLPDTGKVAVYSKVVDSVKVKSIEDMVPLLVRFAKQGLPKQVTDRLFNKVISWFQRKYPDLSKNACQSAVVTTVYDSFNSVWIHVAGTPADEWCKFITDENGEERRVSPTEHLKNRDLLVNTYSAMMVMKDKVDNVRVK